MTREPISLEVLAERLANFMSEERIVRNQDREERKLLLKEVTDLKLAVQKQNGSVATLVRQQDDLKTWENRHDDHHGTDDEAIGKRLDRDNNTRRGVWKAQLAMFTGGGGAVGLSGLVAKLLGYF